MVDDVSAAQDAPQNAFVASVGANELPVDVWAPITVDLGEKAGNQHHVVASGGEQAANRLPMKPAPPVITTLRGIQAVYWLSSASERPIRHQPGVGFASSGGGRLSN